MNEIDLLQLLHTDLSAIACLIIFFVIVLICYFAYKFFDMFWKI